MAAGSVGRLENLPDTIADRLSAGCSLTRVSVDEGGPYPRLRRQLKLVFKQDALFSRMCSSTDDQSNNALENLHRLRHRLLAPIRKPNAFERSGGKNFDEVRALNREKVRRYLEQGIRTRKQLHYKNSDLGDWCRKFDGEWFNAALPAIHQSERREIGRKRACAADSRRPGVSDCACASC